jgi:hypothetical protein
MNRLKKVFGFGFILFLLIFLNSCGLLKNITRTKNKSVAVTEKFIDTNIVLVFDTVPIYDTVLINDTAFLENKTSEARSYWNPKMNKIVLELKGKPFDVNIKLHKKETKTVFTKETKKEPKTFIVIIGFTLLLIFFYFIAAMIVKSIKNLKP